jgi:hypothetical protein
MTKAGSRLVVAILPEDLLVGKSASTRVRRTARAVFDVRAASVIVKKNLKQDDDAYPY